MSTNVNGPFSRGHAHDVRLDDTFDFLNTDDLENGFPIDRIPGLDDALAWFVGRGVIHGEGADRVRNQTSVHLRAVAGPMLPGRQSPKWWCDDIVGYRQATD